MHSLSMHAAALVMVAVALLALVVQAAPAARVCRPPAHLTSSAVPALWPIR